MQPSKTINSELNSNKNGEQLQPESSANQSFPPRQTDKLDFSSLNRDFELHGYYIFKVDQCDNLSNLPKALNSIANIQQSAERGQTRGVVDLTDYMWSSNQKVSKFLEYIKGSEVAEFARVALNKPEIQIGTVLLNTYHRNEFLERHKDGQYRPDLFAVLLVYMTPTADNALELELKSGEKIRPKLEAGDCILLSPDLYHTVHPVESSRKSLLIEFKNPNYR